MSQYNESDRELLEGICKKHDVSTKTVEALLLLEHDLAGMSRRDGLFEWIEYILEQEKKE